MRHFSEKSTLSPEMEQQGHSPLWTIFLQFNASVRAATISEEKEADLVNVKYSTPRMKNSDKTTNIIAVSAHAHQDHPPHRQVVVIDPNQAKEDKHSIPQTPYPKPYATTGRRLAHALSETNADSSTTQQSIRRNEYLKWIAIQNLIPDEIIQTPTKSQS